MTREELAAHLKDLCAYSKCGLVYHDTLTVYSDGAWWSSDRNTIKLLRDGIIPGSEWRTIVGVNNTFYKTILSEIDRWEPVDPVSALEELAKEAE